MTIETSEGQNVIEQMKYLSLSKEFHQSKRFHNESLSFINENKLAFLVSVAGGKILDSKFGKPSEFFV